tara:strand:+ start:414 stop:827 length:414 start_codon:yes stop_codon:yes gene_type:complete
MTNLFKQSSGWADRKLAQLKSLGQSSAMPYVFLTSCVDSTYDDIHNMEVDAVECTYAEMAWNCDLSKFESVFGYEFDSDLELEKDPHIAYYRGIYKETSCYYLAHSAIEYIWVNARNWEAEKVVTALKAAGIEVDVP